MAATYSQTPAELVFPPQVPFSWTLRSARARRLEAAKRAAASDYRIRGFAVGAKGLAAIRVSIHVTRGRGES